MLVIAVTLILQILVRHCAVLEVGHERRQKKQRQVIYVA